MDEYEKAKSLLLINTKEDEIIYRIKSEVDEILTKEYNAVSRVEIRRKLRSILTRYEKETWIKRFLVSTTGRYIFNVEIETVDGPLSFTITLKHS